MIEPEFASNMRQVVHHLDAAQAIISRGPLEFYLRKLVEHSVALLTTFAPLKVGQRARIASNVECRDGWAGCEEMLAVGATGQVCDVDYFDGHFVFDFCPDKQFYVRDGKTYPSSLPHTYALRAEHLEPM